MSGETPVIKASMLRGGYNVLSAVTAQGEMDYSIQDDTINGERYIGFLSELIAGRKRPRATSEACYFLQGASPCLEFKGLNS